MFKVIITYLATSIFRRLYWLAGFYRFSISKSGLRVFFPVVLEGKGSVVVGKSALFYKNASIRCSAGASLMVGANFVLGKEAEVNINKSGSVTAGDNFHIGNRSTCGVSGRWHIGSRV